MNRFPLLLLFVMFLVSSCSNTDFDYSSLHAYFVFDNSQHQDATLQSALNPLSPGVFCRISEGQEGAVTYFYFESNEGLTTKQKANADDVSSHIKAVLQFGKGREEYFLDNLQVAEIARRQIVHDELYLRWQTLQFVRFGTYQLKHIGILLVRHD
jgi:hypothetical protein